MGATKQLSCPYQTKKTKFTQILKEKIHEAALNYLLEKIGKKGKEIEYTSLEMAEYLLPFNKKQSIEEKCEMFALKNSMIDIPANFSSKNEQQCHCGVLEDMVHIYNCGVYNLKKPKILFEKIFTGNLNEQILVHNKFTENMRTRNNLKQISNPDKLCDKLLHSLRDE